MASTIISNQGQYTFGQMTNRLIGALIDGNTSLERLNEAVATASAGFTGTPGTQFEINNAMGGGMGSQNLFGVVADPEEPGAKGNDYSYAIGQLHSAWQAFWAAAKPYVEQLDNGT